MRPLRRPAVLHGCVLRSRDVRAAAERLTGRGARRAQRAVGLADLRAESQPESTLRVLLALGGITTVPQFVVRDRGGGFVGRVDLALPGGARRQDPSPPRRRDVGEVVVLSGRMAAASPKSRLPTGGESEVPGRA